METPLSTGQVVLELDTTEAKLSDLIRTRKIQPPPVVAGRRLWQREHILQAAAALGADALAARPHSSHSEVDRGL